MNKKTPANDHEALTTTSRTGREEILRAHHPGYLQELLQSLLRYPVCQRAGRNLQVILGGRKAYVLWVDHMILQQAAVTHLEFQ